MYVKLDHLFKIYRHSQKKNVYVIDKKSLLCKLTMQGIHKKIK